MVLICSYEERKVSGQKRLKMLGCCVHMSVNGGQTVGQAFDARTLKQETTSMPSPFRRGQG